MISTLIQEIYEGKRTAIARGISIIENELPGSTKILADLFAHTGSAYRIGVTGPPGAGKSSLTDKLVEIFRSRKKKVAVIGVDPTSPFTGGALLGDRIRMMNHFADKGVFIRSMATRGGQGGLAQKTQEVGDVFDAAGFDIILFETVGVGQMELDVIQAADTVLVVLVPESGDEIQMMKAGLMEIGDVFVINKADRDGANKLDITLTNLLSAVPADPETWKAEVVKTIAVKNHGMDDLWSSISRHKSFIHQFGLWQKKAAERYHRQISELVVQKFEMEFWTESRKSELNQQAGRNRRDQINPFTLAETLYSDDR